MKLKHYHMISGMNDYMPDQNICTETKVDAINSLREFSSFVESSCNILSFNEGHIGKCYNGNIWINNIIYFKEGHGVEYAEISVCYNKSCIKELVNA